MTGAVVTAMDRFAAVTTDPQTMEVVGQRVMDGESLKQIAVSWQVPAMRFVTWVIEDLPRLKVYEAALRVRADQMAHETIEIADNPDGDTKRDSLRVRTRLTLASHYDRQRFGSHTEQTVSVKRGIAAEYSDEDLMKLIENANRDAAALEHRSTLVLEQARTPEPPVVDVLEQII